MFNDIGVRLLWLRQIAFRPTAYTPILCLELFVMVAILVPFFITGKMGYFVAYQSKRNILFWKLQPPTSIICQPSVSVWEGVFNSNQFEVAQYFLNILRRFFRRWILNSIELLKFHMAFCIMLCRKSFPKFHIFPLDSSVWLWYWFPHGSHVNSFLPIPMSKNSVVLYLHYHYSKLDFKNCESACA